MQTFRYKKPGVNSITQQFTLADPLTKVQQINYNNQNGYGDYVFVIPFSKVEFDRMCSIDNCYPFSLDRRKMICYFKSILFIGEKPDNIRYHLEWDLPIYYLECYRNIKSGQSECKEVYRLDKFVGYGFEVLKVSYKDPFSNNDHFSISKETIDLLTLFKNQENIDCAGSDALYTNFIEEDYFKKCYDYVLKQLT